ncbi:polysaccharide pyruvyl transferase family protein [Aurantimonas sp. E1-2-R+4]|uniref:polysaccharide pyruvyl transferase family protein n=1 Tax=Aurantimonas sp. E1-2-R+4 TaxID=3113714 RepID=UPI002F92B2DC
MTKRLRVGIVTLQDVPNYGAALQAFALKMTIGHFADIDVINYHNPHVSREMQLVRSARNLRQLMGTGKDLLRLRSRRRALQRFRDFQAEVLKLSPPMTSEELTQRGDDGRDAYICGSDQIWNPSCVSADGALDPVYFLDFADRARKIAYAASVGHYKFNSVEQEKVRELLCGFSALSVREADAVEIVQPLVHRMVHHTLDPTLLIDRAGWEDLLASSGNAAETRFRDPYIFVYSVPKSKLIAPAVSHFARSLRSSVVSFEPDPFFRVESSAVVNDGGPLEFLTLLSKARFVVTDSFHGVCFSILMNRPFVAVSPGIHSNRIVDLLTRLGLMDRYVGDSESLKTVGESVDFSNAKDILGREREVSVSFLKNALLTQVSHPPRP